MRQFNYTCRETLGGLREHRCPERSSAFLGMTLLSKLLQGYLILFA